MAMKKTAPTKNPWDHPVWPEQLPDPAAMRIVYGEFADELVIRFSDRRHHDLVIVVPVAIPEDDFAGMLVAADSGVVLGVHVYPLAASAVKQHPACKQVGEPEPEAVLRLVEDIRELYKLYGIERDDSDVG